MEGRAIARPNASWLISEIEPTTTLQWRAEQSLGQTSRRQPAARPRTLASMEGRAIARPNQEVAARPGSDAIVASMEGRAIARPKPDRTADDGTVDI